MSYQRILIICGLFFTLNIVFVPLPWKKINRQTSVMDDVLLSLIKNDQKSFEAFIEGGGDVHSYLPEIDGKRYTVAEGVAYFECIQFARYLAQKKINFVKQIPGPGEDIVVITIKKNNPELLGLLIQEHPNLKMNYSKGRTLLHLAAQWCSSNLTRILEEKGQLRWDTPGDNGLTPLTLAAQSECLPMLSYWKDRGADFHLKDSKGISPFMILNKKESSALKTFVASIASLRPSLLTAATKVTVPDFYKKRRTPKDQLIDHAATLEPAVRPLEGAETAEFSEFAD